MVGSVTEYLLPARFGFASSQFIGTMSPEVLGPELICTGTTPSTITSNSTVWYHQLLLAAPFTVQLFWWINGSTVDGSTDMGVFSEDGQTLLVSTGAVTNSGVSVPQSAAVTPFTLPPNKRLWLAIGSSSATHILNRLTIGSSVGDAIGIKVNTAGMSGSALAVPATLNAGGSSVIRCGMVGNSVI